MHLWCMSNIMGVCLIFALKALTCCYPQKDSDILLFGGEYLDIKTDKVYVKNELYRFHTGSHTWTQYIVPNGCASSRFHHPCRKQQHCLDTFDLDQVLPSIYMPDMAESLHVFDRPPPRTAHQACLHKQHLYVFGGELTSVNQAGVPLPSVGWRLSSVSQKQALALSELHKPCPCSQNL